MRLTLRTLLAWLDDTLEPGQVREIGKQVAESPFAQELSDRIHRVTRQRRLSIPSGSGPDGTDANVVASYLDNDLDPDSVAEFEKKCLTSDVNLAEVASVHQILSLLGQKVQVPPEARTRMYQLVKGRETVAPPKGSPKRLPPAPEPVTKPIQPWIAPEPPKRPWLERFGPAAACILLIVLASFSAWKSLSDSPADQPSNATVLVAGGDAPPAARQGAENPAAGSSPETPKVVVEAAKSQPNRDGASGYTETPNPSPDTESSRVAKAATEAASKDVPVASVPSGSAGLADKAEGVLLRYNADKREWDRITAATPLNRSDRLLCLTPFRASITIGKIRIQLVGETEIRVLSSSSDAVPALEIVQGRLLISKPASGSLKVAFANRSATLEMTPESTVGLERLEMRTYGQSILRIPPLSVGCIQGEVVLAVDNKSEPIKAGNVAVVDAGGVKVSTPENLPAWTTQSDPTPYELQVRDQFLKMFHVGRPVLAEIVAAIEDDRPEVKQLAVSALKAQGELSLLMPILSREGDPVARRRTIEAIRSYMGLGPDAVNRVRGQLDEEFGESVGAVAQRMLVGYSPEEVSKGDIYPKLVALLSADQQSVGIRELALDSLKRLTGRDDLGYDPDHPAGKGLEAWNDLLRRNELRPLAPRPAKAKSSSSQP